jgi:hypothetical protein
MANDEVSCPPTERSNYQHNPSFVYLFFPVVASVFHIVAVVSPDHIVPIRAFKKYLIYKYIYKYLRK